MQPITPTLAGNTEQADYLRTNPTDHPHAYVGNNTVNAKIVAPQPVHPRLRGEHIQKLPRTNFAGRSPPAARGTRTVSHPSRHARSDHPRTRGKHVSSVMSTALSGRSPPRMPGTPGALWVRQVPRPITPAYAGNTATRSPTSPGTTDYPRARGEHRNSKIPPPPASRSPPRTRGTRDNACCCAAETPITPAHAGNTV